MAIISLTPELIVQVEHIVRNKIPPDKIAELDAAIAHYQQLLIMDSLEPRKRTTGSVMRLERVGENAYKAIEGRKLADHDDEVNKLKTASRNLAAIIEQGYPPIEQILSRTLPSESALLSKDVSAVGEWLEQVAEISNSEPVGDKRKMHSLCIWSGSMAEIIYRPSFPQANLLAGQSMQLILQAHNGLAGIKQWLLGLADAAQQAIKASKEGRPIKDQRQFLAVRLGHLYYKLSGKMPGNSAPRKSLFWEDSNKDIAWGHTFVDFVRLGVWVAEDYPKGKPISIWAARSLIKKILPQLRSELANAASTYDEQ